MPSTFFGLDIGKTGLYAYQAALNTTGHNIANTETAGYSRQITNIKAGDPLKVNSRYGMAGSGVQVDGVLQVRNSYYDIKYRNNNTLYGHYSTKNYYMSSIQNYYNEVSVDGFTTTFDKMFDSLQELSKNTAGLPERTQVVNYGKSLTEYFNNMYNGLQTIQDEANFEIKNQIDRVNSLSQQIASITSQINTLETGGGTANDLRDARNLLVDELSNIANVSTEEKFIGNGVSQYVVRLNGQLLVDTFDYNTLEVVPRSEKINQTDLDGLYEIKWKNGQPFNVNGGGLGGTLQALLEVRDGNARENLHGVTTGNEGDTTVKLTGANINDIRKLNIPPTGTLSIGSRDYTYTGFDVSINPDGSYEYTFQLTEGLVKDVDNIEASIGKGIDYKGIPYYMAQMNEFVRTFSDEFNQIHKTGQDLKGEQGLDFFNGKHPVTGENYVFTNVKELTGFSSTDSSYYQVTAGNFTVTDAIYKDPNKIAITSNIVDGVENKDVLDKLLALKSDGSMFKQGTPASFLQTLVAQVGVDAKKTETFEENQLNIMKTIENQRLSVSGVDMDEESMNLVRYKFSYDLCSKVISVMDEIYNKLINEMGV